MLNDLLTHDFNNNFIFNTDVSKVVCRKSALEELKWRNNGIRLLAYWHTFNLILLAQSNSFGTKKLKQNYPLENNFPSLFHKCIQWTPEIINYSSNIVEKWSCIELKLQKYQTYRIMFFICISFLDNSEQTLIYLLFSLCKWKKFNSNILDSAEKFKIKYWIHCFNWESSRMKILHIQFVFNLFIIMYHTGNLFRNDNFFKNRLFKRIKVRIAKVLVNRLIFCKCLVIMILASCNILFRDFF